MRAHCALVPAIASRTPPLSLDEARLLPRYQEAFEHAENVTRQAVELRAKLVRREPPARKLPPGGDPRDLRGIPAIGRGVSGASPGTSPHHEGVRRADHAAEIRARAAEPMVAFL